MTPSKVNHKLLHFIVFLRKKHGIYIDLLKFGRLHVQHPCWVTQKAASSEWCPEQGGTLPQVKAAAPAALAAWVM